MVIRKILARLWGSGESDSTEDSREPLSFEEARALYERAQAEFEAAQREMRELQQRDEAAGRGITDRWIAASQRTSVLGHRLRKAKEHLAKAGGSPDRVELTELVTRKVRQWLPEGDQAEAIRLLETECARNLPFHESSSAEDLEAVRLAVVKLAGGTMEGLRRHLKEAQTDWRDVLIYAQAPEEVARGYYTVEDEADADTLAMKARDQQQYEDWLRGAGPPNTPAT